MILYNKKGFNMETLFEILKVILPAVITSLFTFFITKYTYNKNIPLDKLEISYNRIYYPLYEIIKNRKDTNEAEYFLYLDFVIQEAEWRIKKYCKYVDRATLKTFYLTLYSNTQTKKQYNFNNFKNNIYSMNSYLRKRLGYLEPDLLQQYKYSSDSEKFKYRFLFELLFIFVFTILGTVFTNKLQVVFLNISVFFMSIVFIETCIKIIMFLCFKISEIIEKIKKNRQ